MAGSETVDTDAGLGVESKRKVRLSDALTIGDYATRRNACLACLRVPRPPLDAPCRGAYSRRTIDDGSARDGALIASVERAPERPLRTKDKEKVPPTWP